jgi:hypothetical protein
MVNMSLDRMNLLRASAHGKYVCKTVEWDKSIFNTMVYIYIYIYPMTHFSIFFILLVKVLHVFICLQQMTGKMWIFFFLLQTIRFNGKKILVSLVLTM